MDSRLGLRASCRSRIRCRVRRSRRCPRRRHRRSRRRCFSAAARAIRQLLVESARRKKSLKRGGDWDRVEIEPGVAGADRLDMLALDEALAELAQADPRAAQVVELRVFGGVSIDHTAEMLGVGHATVERDWAAARAWLLSRIGGADGTLA